MWECIYTPFACYPSIFLFGYSSIFLFGHWTLDLWGGVVVTPSFLYSYKVAAPQKVGPLLFYPFSFEGVNDKIINLIILGVHLATILLVFLGYGQAYFLAYSIFGCSPGLYLLCPGQAYFLAHICVLRRFYGFGVSLCLLAIKKGIWMDWRTYKARMESRWRF